MWSPQANKKSGEGDIAASYSADRIGMGEPIRKPFSWRGALWVNVGSATFEGRPTVEAYRLVAPESYGYKPHKLMPEIELRRLRSSPAHVYGQRSVNYLLFLVCWIEFRGTLFLNHQSHGLKTGITVVDNEGRYVGYAYAGTVREKLKESIELHKQKLNEVADGLIKSYPQEAGRSACGAGTRKKVN